MRLRFINTGFAIDSRLCYYYRVLPAQRRCLTRSAKSVKQRDTGVVRREELGTEMPKRLFPRDKTAEDQNKSHSRDMDSLNLPLPPLMDPDLQAARNRHKTPKPQRNGELSEFQQKLSKNPYGPSIL